MAISKTKKHEIVDSLKEKLSNAKSVVFIDYTGIKVKETQKLKKRLLEVGSEYAVSKKNLLEKALESVNISGWDSSANKGSCALVINNTSEVAGIKTFYEFNKEYKKKNKKNFPILNGIFEGKIISKEEVDSLSNVLSKEEFISKFMYILNSSAASFARTLQAVADKKQSGEPVVAEVKEEVKIEEAPVAVATEEAKVEETTAPAAEATPIEEAPAA